MDILNLRHKIELASKIPCRQLINIIGRRLRIKVLQLVREAQVRMWTNWATNIRLDTALNDGIMLSSLAYRMRQDLGRCFFLSPVDRDERLRLLREVAPEAEAPIVTEANRICDHIFDLLGSGPTSLGKKIDWHSDFKSGHRWNPKTYYRHIRPATYPGGYDIKVPWELSRCQHFVRLGQAYWIMGDEKYAREFVAQVEDWIASNPWPYGVNWSCAMDVAIRAVNWLWGLAFFLDAPSVSAEFLVKLARSLLVHGRHIMSNLEGHSESRFTNNHYLANLVGLIYLGVCCPYLKEARQWLEFGTSQLEREMFEQVYADGVDFEASVSYHRLVAELFLSAVLLTRLNGHAFGKPFMERLEKMLQFTIYVTKPDGTVPLIGDNDNGRLHRLTVWQKPEREWVDHRYLLAVGAVLFERVDFAQAAGDQWKEAIWLFGSRALPFKQEAEAKGLSSLQLKSRAFPDAGLYIMRYGNLYAIVDAGPNGQRGRGGHAHNDTLSFELYAHGQTWIVDPGTYVYTADYEARNQFRSTAFHNTVMVDGEEQNRFNSTEPFRMLDDATVKIVRWETDQASIVLTLEHTGYTRLPDPVTHRREILFDKEERSFIIRDWLLAKHKHQLKMFLHFAPGIIVKRHNKWFMAQLTDNSNAAPQLVVQWKSFSNTHIEMNETEISYGYGNKSRAKCLLFCSQDDYLETRLSFEL